MADESPRDVGTQHHPSKGSEEILMRGVDLGLFLFNLCVRTH